MQCCRILTVVAAAAVSLSAQAINVSKIVTGVQTATPNIGFYLPNGTPYANVDYYPVVHGKTGADPLDMYPGSWAQNWANAVSNPAIKRQTNSPAPVPIGNGTISYAKPYTQLAQAGLNNQNKQFTTAATFGSGSASTESSYAVRVENFGGSSTDYYLTITVPERKQYYNPAFSLCCSGDSNGGTYGYMAPKSIASRASVDVYADGLPVWGSEKTYQFPTGANSPWADPYQLSWGSTAAANTNVLLYLGRFKTGQAVDFTIVVRTDATANAPTCGDESSYGSVIRHCLDFSETITMKPSGNPAVPAMYFWSHNGITYRGL